MLCKECGANLPDGAQFCVDCGRGTSETPNEGANEARAVSRSRLMFRIAIWFLVPFVVLAVWWAANAVSPGAQQLREVFTPLHTETVTEKTFSVNSHSFASYKFTVPSGTTDVVVNGEFSATGDPDNDVEVFILADDAFVTWRSGYSASTIYDSGRVTHGNIDGTLPAGVGSYYLVFDNRFSSRTAKAIHADVTLRYQKWLPDWLLYLKEKLRDLVNAT